MTYRPEPIDTAGIELPPEIVQLRELLARNAHDLWARDRIKQGWTYGPERDDAKKHNPCLVAYEELPDSEKQFDRNNAMETLKAILKLGYRIQKKA
jgi:RyR domain-containing protein